MTLGLLALLVGVLPSGLELDWQAPAGVCPDREAVEREIERLKDPASGSARLRVSMRARPVASGLGWTMEIRSWSESGEDTRQLEAASCADLVPAAAVIVAMALSEGAPPRLEAPSDTSGPTAEPRSGSIPARDGTTPSSRGDPPRSDVTPTPSGGDSSRSDAAEVPSTERAVPTRDEASSGGLDVGLSLRLEGTADLGGLPSLAPGLALQASLQLRVPMALRFELGFGARAPQHQILRPDPEAGGDFVWFDTAARVCVLPLGDERWSFGACAGFELGFLRAAGFGVTDPSSALELVPGLQGDLWLSLAISSTWTVVLRTGVAAPLARPMFTLEPLGELHQASALVARAALGVEFELF